MESNESNLDSSSSCVVQITQSNIDSVLASNELVFIFRYSDRCRYCTRLMPKYEQAAKEITEAGFSPGNVVMAKLNYRKEETINARFKFYYYPYFVLVRNGLQSRNDYRGEHTVEAFVEFVKKQLSDPIIPFSDLNELHNLSEDEGHIIAYLDSRDQPEYDVLRKVASSLREEYRFYVKFGDPAAQMNRTGQKQLSVVLRLIKGTPVQLDETYHGSLLSFSDIISWVKQMCFPILREITSGNEDKLRNMGSPIVILIHMPSDTQTLKKYKEAINREWKPENHQLNFFIADGTRCEPLLVRFSKSISDLPLIAISYYCSVNLFDFNVTEKPGKLKEIYNEAYSSDFFHQGIINLYRLCTVIDDSEEEYNICGLFE